MVYGLPLQTVDSFRRTIERAIKLNTDRIVTFSYAHVPSVIPRQKVLDNIGFPSSDEKAQMYEESYESLIKAGYVSIGMDHYSKPHDEFAIALKEKNYTENFQGLLYQRNNWTGIWFWCLINFSIGFGIFSKYKNSIRIY